ncbi:MAG: hypothetical protein O2930_02490 [Acidobacteria bacterium]|nr:hypothetical protein [Acidobacteriota bacterium]
MRNVMYVVFGLALVGSLGSGGVVAARQADMVKTHIGHVTTSFQAAPMEQGLLPTAVAEAGTAAQHAGLVVSSDGDLAAMQRHAGHVLHALDPSVEAQGPGLGYGVKRAAMGVAQHIGLAAMADGASDNVMTHAMHVAASANNVVARADEMLAVAQQIRSATTAAEASAHLAELSRLAEQLYAGVDANQDGRVGWQTGEGGLQQAEMHMGLMLKGEGA